jgi:hypothetical protein
VAVQRGGLSSSYSKIGGSLWFFLWICSQVGKKTVDCQKNAVENIRLSAFERGQDVFLIATADMKLCAVLHNDQILAVEPRLKLFYVANVDDR